MRGICDLSSQITFPYLSITSPTDVSFSQPDLLLRWLPPPKFLLPYPPNFHRLPLPSLPVPDTLPRSRTGCPRSSRPSVWPEIRFGKVSFKRRMERSAFQPGVERRRRRPTIYGTGRWSQAGAGGRRQEAALLGQRGRGGGGFRRSSLGQAVGDVQLLWSWTSASSCVYCGERRRGSGGFRCDQPGTSCRRGAARVVADVRVKLRPPRVEGSSSAGEEQQGRIDADEEAASSGGLRCHETAILSSWFPTSLLPLLCVILRFLLLMECLR
jgi:hypothetical protein